MDAGNSSQDVIRTGSIVCDLNATQIPETRQESTDQHRNLLIDKPNEPIGIILFGRFIKFNNISAKRNFHKALVLCITFVSYGCLHMGRRPLSIVKNVLNQNCSITVDYDYDSENFMPMKIVASKENCSSWAPFDGDPDDANRLLALLDSAFLFSYAIFMFFSGYIADHCNLRYFLTGGMFLSGTLLYVFGLAFYLDIHSMYFFATIQVLSGLVQTAGWPTVVACIGNWFEPSSRGSVFGVWNACTNVGNILGAVVAGYFVQRAWGLSFIVPGFILLIASVLTFMFLAPRPVDVHLVSVKSMVDSKASDGSSYRNNDRDMDVSNDSQSTVIEPSEPRPASRRKIVKDDNCDLNEDGDSLTRSSNDEQSPLISQNPNEDIVELVQPVSFWTCLKIPGVIEYSVSLGFSKLVSYTFLYWLPRYIAQSTSNNSEQSAYLSVPFDIGGIFGGIAAGFLSDKLRKSACVCSLMLILAIPSMYIYEQLASKSNIYNISFQLVTGILVTGPYALITTAVSADLGSRVKNGKAMATVAAIIDGSGSIGAAVGPLFAGYVAESGWQSVFLMLMSSDLIAVLLLTRITLKELGLR